MISTNQLTLSQSGGQIITTTLLLLATPDFKQTCRPGAFVISYLLFWPAFIWRIFFGEENFRWLLSKKQSGWWKFALLDQLLFISHFVFRRQPAEFFFSKKCVKWKQFKVTKMILQSHQVLCRFDFLRTSYGPVPNVLRNWSVPSPSWFLWHAGSSNFFQYFPPPLFENESVVLCTLTVLF